MSARARGVRTASLQPEICLRAKSNFVSQSKVIPAFNPLDENISLYPK
jgi:hypothetical protein